MQFESSLAWRAPISKGNAADTAEAHNYSIDFDATGRFYGTISNGTLSDVLYPTTPTLTDTASFHHVVFKWDGSNLRWFLDGLEKASTPQTITPVGNGSNLYFGRWGSGNDWFDGIIDEVRVANVPRSSCWIEAEFNNQSAPGDIGAPNFYTVGAEKVDTGTVGTTTSAVGIWSGSQRYIHYADGYYWAVFYNGTDPYLYSSPNTTTWTSQGTVNVTLNEVEKASDVSARFSGTTMIVAYSDDSTAGGGSFNQLYYRQATLNSNGTVTWWPASSDHLVPGVGTGHDAEVHAAFDSQGQPWVGGTLTNDERFRVVEGSAQQSPTWTDHSPAVYTFTTSNPAHAGVLHPIADDGDMYGFTTANYTADRDIIGP
jgi:hypothetical protein